MLSLETAHGALSEAYRGVSRVALALGPVDMLGPTRCAGWSVADVLFHLVRDAQRGLVALAAPAPRHGDVDFVTYWRPFSSVTPDSWEQARAVRIGASAFPDYRSLINSWLDTSEAVLHLATRAQATEAVATQGHVLSVPDFLVTLAVEATVHHLDLIVDLPEAAPPGAEALAVTRLTLDGLLGASPPADWNDVEYALKGTGRLELSEADRSVLGARAEQCPLFC